MPVDDSARLRHMLDANYDIDEVRVWNTVNHDLAALVPLLEQIIGSS
jgi:uncharacterized protein with HEPN domain